MFAEEMRDFALTMRMSDHHGILDIEMFGKLLQIIDKGIILFPYQVCVERPQPRRSCAITR